MDYKEIQNLIKLVGSSNVSELKIETDEMSLTIRTKDYCKGSKVVAQPVVSYQQTPQLSNSPIQENYSAPTLSSVSDQKPIHVEQTPEKKSDLKEIKSPIVGTFYRSPSPDKEPYVKIGDHIEQNMIVCIVEAMKLFNEIEAEYSGKVVDILVEDGSPVEYDQVLFLIDTKG